MTPAISAEQIGGKLRDSPNRVGSEFESGGGSIPNPNARVRRTTARENPESVVYRGSRLTSGVLTISRE